MPKSRHASDIASYTVPKKAPTELEVLQIASSRVIPITVIKCSTQSYVCAQRAIEIDEDIVVTNIQSCRYYIAKSRQF
ncbi:hypothetical protein D5R81_05150 [Parashewanella spongiae]|uniref:Uncharacterized protein n=1 Tax=Parashewanella spongiae TaxID=342950 RepID=A0A3A6U3A3_9GAMM|nr:hypothetical protein D5R81_05150 [Parashewanella spongiae]